MDNTKYEVYVGDNFHYMEESKLPYASFDTLEEAVEYCEAFVIRNLSEYYEPGITPDKLRAQWAMFGEDPFIRGGNQAGIPFSARAFITEEICQNVINSLSSN